MAIHVGRVREGWIGLLVAGTCFIFPAALLTGALAWLYVRYGRLPEVSAVFYCVHPVVTAVVAHAAWGFARPSLKTVSLALCAATAALLNLLGIGELTLLIGAGIAFAGFRMAGVLPAIVPLGAIAGLSALAVLFFTFLKTGAVLFGSGYVLLAFLRTDLVDRYHWLTEQQLLDAIAAGQMTPGPVFATATFVGYVLAGLPGAVVSTIGIFLPAFVFVAATGPYIPRLRQNRGLSAFLDAVIAASWGLLAVVVWKMGRAALVDWSTILFATAALVILFTTRINSVWLILAGAAGGLASRFLTANV
jgi:chromate transporter